MKSKKLRLMGFIILLILVAVFILIPREKTRDFKSKYENAGDLSTDVEGIGRENTYAKYLMKHSETAYPDENIDIDIKNYKNAAGVELLAEYEGVPDALLTGEDSYAEWTVEVPASGMYQILMEYYPVKSRGVDIERKIYINGEVPFFGADALSFTRLWTNKNEVKRDNQGNDIRPSQIDIPDWIRAYFKDDLGYFSEPYTFYFEKGNNTIGLEAVNEPAVIKSLTLCAVTDDINYSGYLANLPEFEETEKGLTYSQIIQGEASTLRSSPALYAIYDRSSSKTEPYSVSKIRLNMIGGNAWRIAGQWIEWEFEVPEQGFYNITLKGRQNYVRGSMSNRAVYIDGQIPFSELEQVGFQYNNEWDTLTLSDSEKEAYQFYLDKGVHTIRLEVTLGDLGDILNSMQDSVYRLNEMYRKILVLTGTTPDKYRDYKIAQIYPEVMQAMELEAKRLYKIIDDIVEYSGEKSDQVAPLETLAKQLEKFVKNPDKIPGSFTNFKDNVSAMGTAILKMSEAPLDIDYIAITGKNVKPERVRETFADRFVHEVRSFVASFTEDYNAVGDVYDKEEAIQVWILSGRDQSTILKMMIDDTFTPETQIKVNVKLVEPGTLLNAIIAGKGPDVVISAGQGEPVNYALRSAVEDLSQFSDLGEVLKDFRKSAYTPFLFEDGIYALPETQNFNVLFYRKDILDQLEIQVPETWDDLIAILPIIQQNNMSVAIPTTERVLNNSSNPDLSSMFALLYQNGGTVYDEKGKSTVIDSESGVKAFETFTKLFTHYKLPTIYDFPNQFRSGQMPMGIADYSTFNTLVVFAPEIRGLWDFTVIPGTVMEDGSINRSCHSNGLGTFMTKQDDDEVKQKAWRFMKWWVSADAQVRFGQEMESVMGASARYATANTAAFKQLSWSHSQLEVLEEQSDWAVGLREIAGGYYTGRHITNAIRKVINKKEDPRETLLDYTRTINEEIEKKRLEFGLDIRGREESE
ncbi:ABC-type glycerol-3-phosphate transport system substrate-binding protein [Anaerotaenia torta]|uniref:extracellular solute-binding protein n=1 Tax=Anaerotaenia torta TaxID=433293 RepID=UPI003D1D1AEB